MKTDFGLSAYCHGNADFANVWERCWPTTTIPIYKGASVRCQLSLRTSYRHRNQRTKRALRMHSCNNLPAHVTVRDVAAQFSARSTRPPWLVRYIILAQIRSKTFFNVDSTLPSDSRNATKKKRLWKATSPKTCLCPSRSLSDK